MKLKRLQFFLVPVLFAFALSCSGGTAEKPVGETETAPVGKSESIGAEKTVKKTIELARQGKTESALEYVGVEEISRYLLGGEYEKVSPDQQKKFNLLIRDFVALRGLPQAMKLLKNRDAESIDFEPARSNGDSVLLPSSLPGTSLKVTWILKKKGRKYVITDFLDHRGRSSMQRSRDKQIMPGYRRYGMDGLMERLEKAINRMR